MVSIRLRGAELQTYSFTSASHVYLFDRVGLLTNESFVVITTKGQVLIESTVKTSEFPVVC